MVLAVILKITMAETSTAGPARSGGGARGQQVSEVIVADRTFSDQIRALGVARGRRSINVTSSTTELITRVLFSDGQRVSTGAPLVELQAGEEDAGLVEARARLEQAQREYDRYAALAERGVAPRVTAENARTELERARAALGAAEARHGDRMIRAPFSGVLGLSTVAPGTLINPGAVIATLDDISVIRVDFPVPERFVPVLKPGVPISASIDAYPGETFQGRIALLDTRVDDQTRAVTARAEFPNPGDRILPGMMVRVGVQHGRRSAPAAPEPAIQYEGRKAFVYRIASNEEGSIAQRVEIQTGLVEGGFVEIVSGLQAGDRLVASGLNRIQPGAPVHVADPAADPAAGAASQ
jgi:membrane fusion protein (multidrug efflux system)